MSCWVNLLDYTATVFPVTTANKDIDKIDDSYEPRSETDRKIWETCKFGIDCIILLMPAVRLILAIDDPEIYDGAYVGVQLVGRRLQEEKMLAITNVLSNALSQ
jgi:amidase